MKKVLLASSILALTAGAASAEIALSGSARMGLVYDSISGDTVFSSRVRVVFNMSGETDGGLSFGASMRADQTGGNGATTVVTGVGPGPDGVLGTADDVITTGTIGNTGTTNGDSTVFISGAFGKLTMGDVSGAADALVGQTSGVGYGPNDALQEIGFLGTDKTAAYYEYSTGALTFGVGAGQTNTGSQEINVAVKYSAGGYSAALGYEQSDPNVGATVGLLSLSGSATFGAATVKARISDSDIAGADTAYSVSLDYVTGPTTLTAFYTDFGNTTAFSADTQHVGIGAAYDLGGGATLAGGIVRQMNAGAVADETFADVGVKFSF